MAVVTRRRATVEHGSPADTALRLAVLLEAGLTPATAWRHLGDRSLGDDPIAGLAARGGAWRDLSAAWTVATTVGAPLAETLRGIGGALRDAEQTLDDVRVALAEPAATARLMSWLPLVGLGMGLALGFDTLRMVTTNPVGLGALVGGAALVAAARLWTRRLVRRARAAAPSPGLDAELLAVALSGGVSIARAKTVCRGAGVEPTEESDRALALSTTAGAPAVELLRGSASLARHRARTEGRVRAATLASRLLLPLGVCVLPAFLLLGVAPMMLSVFTTTSLSL